MQVTIEFKPLRAGDHKGEMTLKYDTGGYRNYLMLHFIILEALVAQSIERLTASPTTPAGL